MRMLCFSIAIAMAAGTLSLQEPEKVTMEWDWSQFFTSTPDGWFDPSYPNHGLPENWQIGHHTYTTRDLMGRNI